MSDFLIIAGLSGAGRSTAADAFEDAGWFVIDNMPSSLLNKVSELVISSGSETDKVALVLGRAGGEKYEDELLPALEELKSKQNRVTVLFLDASEEVLVRRFEGTRRRHPISAESISEAIATERRLLQSIRDVADIVVDTSDLNIHQLKSRLADVFRNDGHSSAMQVQVMSFGFKNGAPVDADTVLDVRFLPNPHWVDSLRELTGLDKQVRAFVIDNPQCQELLDRLKGLFQFLLPLYSAEGKSYFTVAIGCTGGRHRSVAIVEELAKEIKALGYMPYVHHRDISK
jgi:UPF0042 nucleotide-binding protein